MMGLGGTPGALLGAVVVDRSAGGSTAARRGMWLVGAGGGLLVLGVLDAFWRASDPLLFGYQLASVLGAVGLVLVGLCHMYFRRYPAAALSSYLLGALSVFSGVLTFAIFALGLGEGSDRFLALLLMMAFGALAAVEGSKIARGIRSGEGSRRSPPA